MQLKKVRIRDFRCIEDSDEFSVDEVTCLVGKNESGKTAILKALHKLKSAGDKDESFTPSSDYPKRKWIPSIPVPNDPHTLETTWELSAADMSAIEKQFGKGVVTDKFIHLSKSYDNVRRYTISHNTKTAISNLIDSASLSEEERKPLDGSDTLESLKKNLESLAQRTPTQEALYKRIEQVYKDGVTKSIINFVDLRVPTFLYFDQYLRLPGEISVDALLAKKQNNTLTDNDRIFLALLRLAGTKLETLHGTGTFEEFNSTLKSISNQITDQIFKYWTQNKHLDVSMRLDNARPND
ncbi:MAG: AAA family ATPase, partial [Candidatus Saccharimonadales bacterium]